MTSRLARVLVVAVAVWGLAGAAVAYASYADTPSGALHDCGAGHDPLKGHYSLKVLQEALKDVKAEPLQYTNCATILEAAISADSLGKRKPPSSPAPTKAKATLPGHKAQVSLPPSLLKKREQQLQDEGGSPVKLPGWQTVTPGAVTARSASFLSGLPTPLVIVLAALLAAVVAVSGRAIQNVVRARRTR